MYAGHGMRTTAIKHRDGGHSHTDLALDGPRAHEVRHETAQPNRRMSSRQTDVTVRRVTCYLLAFIACEATPTSNAPFFRPSSAQVIAYKFCWQANPGNVFRPTCPLRLMVSPMLTHTKGQRCTKLVVPSNGSTILQAQSRSAEQACGVR